MERQGGTPCTTSPTKEDLGGAVRSIEAKLSMEANKLTLRFGLMWAAAVIIVALLLP